MELRLEVRAWSAWAPTLASLEQWQSWSGSRCDIVDDGKGPVPAGIPGSLRRRFGRTTLIAAELLYRCSDGKVAPDLCMVFSSRHGEAVTTEKILRCVARNEDVSPTDFMLSVHNTTAGLLSLAYKVNASNTAVAAGNGSLAAGLIEAAGIASRSGDAVAYVYTDDTIPDIFKEDGLAAEPVMGIVLVLEPAGRVPGAPSLQLSWRGASKEPPAGAVLEPLAFVKWLLGTETVCALGADSGWLTVTKHLGADLAARYK